MLSKFTLRLACQLDSDFADFDNTIEITGDLTGQLADHIAESELSFDDLNAKLDREAVSHAIELTENERKAYNVKQYAFNVANGLPAIAGGYKEPSFENDYRSENVR